MSEIEEKEQNFSIVNFDYYKEMSIKYGRSKKWLNFTRKLPRNQFVKDYLYGKYDMRCQYCGKPLNPYFVIHHVSYDNECKTSETIRQLHPTPKHPEKNVKVPDCRMCSFNTPDIFQKCMSTTVPVCRRCNWEISQLDRDAVCASLAD